MESLAKRSRVIVAASVGILLFVAGVVVGWQIDGSSTSSATTQGSGITATSNSVSVSGFSVHLISARVNALQAEVDLQINGKPESGNDLIFAPGPNLVWPDGETSHLVSGKQDGRNWTLRFDRPAGLAVAQDTQLKVGFLAVLSPGGTPGPLGDSRQMTFAMVTVASVTPSVNLRTDVRQPFGPGSIHIEDVTSGGGAIRISGHLVGFTEAELSSISLQPSAVVTDAGVASAATGARVGDSANSDPAFFEIDFVGQPSVVAKFDVEMALESAPGIPPEELSRLQTLPGHAATATIEEHSLKSGSGG